MAQDDGVNFSVGADVGPMIASMKRAEEAMKASAATMKSSLEGIGSGLAKIQTAFVAFAAVATGGEAMKRIIQSAGAWQLESVKLAKALGTTTEQASVYQVALARIGVSSDVMLTASAKMSKQIYSHAEDFSKLGVAVKDTDGRFRPMAEVMGEVNQKLLAITNPIAQNIAGQKAYGRGWEEIRPLLKLTGDQMAIAEQRATQLGLKVGPEGAAMAKRYKESLADVDLVGKSLTLQLGNALLPVMTNLGSAFASAAPAIGETFGNVLKIVAGLAIDLGAGMAALGTHIGGLLAAGMAALHGDFSGAREILKQMSDDVDAIEKKANDMKAKLSAPPPKSSAPDLGGADPFGGDEPGGGSRTSEWETKLAEQKAAFEEQGRAAGSFREFDKSQELAYWQNILATTSTSLEEKRSLRRKVADAEAAISKQSFEAELAALKVQEAETGKNADARIAIAQVYAARMKVAYGEDSKQYQEAAKHVVEIELQKQEQLRQIRDIHAATARNAELAKVNAAEEDARLQVELGLKTNAELIAQQRAFEDARYAIRREALIQERADLGPNRDTVEYAKVSAEIEALALEHETKMGDLIRQSTKEATREYSDLYKSIGQGFQSSLSQMLQGTQTFQSGLRAIFKGLMASFADLISKLVMDWVKGEIAKTAMSRTHTMLRSALVKLGLMSDVAAQGAASASTTGIKGIEADAVITANAGEAASGAAASVASIPYVGWAMAAGVFAATLAMVLGAKHSAAGGFDVPGGMNPVTQLHQREMVLPAHIADPLRDSLAGGGGLGGGMTVNVQTFDAHGVASYFKNNAHHLAPALRALHRNSVPVFR